MKYNGADILSIWYTFIILIENGNRGTNYLHLIYSEVQFTKIWVTVAIESWLELLRSSQHSKLLNDSCKQRHLSFDWYIQHNFQYLYQKQYLLWSHELRIDIWVKCYHPWAEKQNGLTYDTSVIILNIHFLDNKQKFKINQEFKAFNMWPKKYIISVFFLFVSFLRGRSFDLEGRGPANLVGTDYLFSTRARPENLFPGKPKTEYLFSTAANFWKSDKTKMGGG